MDGPEAPKASAITPCADIDNKIDRTQYPGTFIAPLLASPLRPDMAFALEKFAS